MLNPVLAGSVTTIGPRRVLATVEPRFPGTRRAPGVEHLDGHLRSFPGDGKSPHRRRNAARRVRHRRQRSQAQRAAAPARASCDRVGRHDTHPY